MRKDIYGHLNRQFDSDQAISLQEKPSFQIANGKEK